MQLTFNSTEDLDLFLNWANLYRAPGVARVVPPYPTIDGVAFDTPPAEAGHDPEDTRMPPAVTGDPSGECLQPAAESTKRKRRTKAEIEADEATALAKAAAAGRVSEEGANAGEAALEAARKVLHDKAALPTGTNPFEQHGHTAGIEALRVLHGERPEGEASGEPEIVTPFQHLTRAREFIGKHGMPKYNESFVAARLDPNVMGYTAEQRVAHIAALDALEAS